MAIGNTPIAQPFEPIWRTLPAKPAFALDECRIPGSNQVEPKGSKSMLKGRFIIHATEVSS